MSDYTPEEQDFIRVYGVDGIGVENQANANRARRGIAKIKADALREAAGEFVGSGEVRDELESYLHRVADRIEEEA